MPTDTDGSPPSVYSTPKGGLYGGPFDPADLDANVRALIMDFRWTKAFGGAEPATKISYFFPQDVGNYSAVTGYPSPDEIANFQPVTAVQKTAVLTAFALVTSYTGLEFFEASSGLASAATLRVSQYPGTGSESRFPPNQGKYSASDSRDAGDTFLGGNGKPPADFFGTDHFNTIMHELGHSFGLKHGHDGSYNGMLSADRNDNEFSVMTYASYLGSPTGTASEARPGSAPQSYMMYDIAALQALYGANFSKVDTTSVYKWDAVTGRQSINDMPAPWTGVTSTNKIFSTVWTQGATTTYDLSNFSGNQVDSLKPGEWLTFSVAQLADLNEDADAGTPQFRAKGNIYNALLYNGDERSLVSNVITGSGNDTVTGNTADNKISTGAGNDTIDGGGGHDTVSAGTGADTINMTRGRVTLHDSAADMDDDTIVGVDSSDSIDFAGLYLDQDDLTVTKTASTTTVKIGAATIDMSGDFTDGAFMVAARGIGAEAHTSVTFVSFLPSLSEGMRIDAGAINGVANEAFLTGDGEVQFSLQLRSAVSAYANTLGIYRVAQDGTIHDVDILFANTLAASTTTISLGTPGDGEHIGFFLIQDGFRHFGSLPDNLSFEIAGGAPANLEAGLPPALVSASLGQLDAMIFHSFGTLNQGNAEQVLSGVTPGGQELLFGFEDLPTATGDNDFQDVVFGVWASHDSNFIL